MFDIGREVEVSFDEAYCRDTWFPATILEDLGNGRFLTEYCRSYTNKTKPLKVAVGSLHIRPCPPLLNDKCFCFLEKVDAYFNFGWWSGVITKQLEDKKYVVFFQQTKQDKEFDQSLLRPHMEWKGGKWFPSQEVSGFTPGGVPLQHHTHESFSGTSLVAPRNNSEKKSSLAVLDKANNQFKRLISCVERPSPATRSLAQKQINLSDLRDTLSHPKRRKEAIVPEGNQKDRNRRSSIKSLSGCVSPGPAGNMISFARQSPLHLSFEKPTSSNTKTRRKGIVDFMGNHGKVNVTSCSKNNEQILEGESPEAQPAGAEPGAIRRTENNVQNGNGRKEAEHPTVIVNLACPIMESSNIGVLSGEYSLRSITKELMMKQVNVQMQQQPLDCSATETSKDSKQLDATGVFGEKRKRGRPRKTPPKSLQTWISAAEIIVDAPSDPTNRRENVPERAVAKDDDEKTSSGTALSVGHENSSKRGRTKSEGEMSTTQITDSLDACNPITLNHRMVVDKSATNVLQDNGPGTSPVSTVEQCTDERLNLDTDALLEEHNVRQKKSGKEDSSSVEPDEECSLVVKSSVIWGVIESMEVFQRLPQKPHFAPLKTYRESLREGLAIGYMVTFSSVVEKASKLQLSDPKSFTDDILETLEDLEEHGFDVTVIRDRITSLLAVKVKQGELANVSDTLNDQCLELNSEKSRIEKEICETNEQIRKLQEKLSLAESVKETEDGEIANLQAKLTEIEENIMIAEHEFDTVASAVLEYF